MPAAMFTRNFPRYYILILFLFSSINVYSTEFYIFKKDGKEGLKDATDKVVVPAKYDELGWTEGAFEVKQNIIGYRSGSLWGLITVQNKKVTEPIYNYLSVQNTGVYVLANKKNNLTGKNQYGLINLSGDTKISFRYSKLVVVNESVIAHYPVGNNKDKVGLLNMSEKQIIPFQYHSLSPIGPLRFSAETERGTFKLFSDEGTDLLDYELDSIGKFYKGSAKIWKEANAGLIDESGEIIVMPEYKDVRMKNGRAEVLSYPVWREFNEDNSPLGEYLYDHVEWVGDTTLQVQAQGKTWLVGGSGVEINEDRYSHLDIFIEGQSIAKYKGQYGVVELDGNWLIPPLMDSIIRKNEFYYTIDRKQRWRIYDRFGVEKTNGYYDEIGEYMKLYFPVRKGDYWGLIYRSGKQVINCVYDSIGMLQYEMLPIKFQGLYGIIDIYGNWVVVPDENKKTPIDDRLYIEYQGDNKLLKRYNGEIIYFTSNDIVVRNNHFLEYLSNGKVWKIDFDGVIQSKEVVDVIHTTPVVYSEFEDIFVESEGLTGIKKDGKYGFVDSQNRLRIANRYDSIKNFNEGFAPIKLLGKWGFIDKDEKIRIQPVYDWVGRFSNGVSMVRQADKYYLIDQNHRKFFTNGFDEMELNDWGRYKVRKGEFFGLVSKNGEMRVNYIYDEILDLGSGLVIIKKLSKYGAVDLNGLNIIPRIYDDLYFDSTKKVFFGKVSTDWTLFIND